MPKSCPRYQENRPVPFMGPAFFVCIARPIRPCEKAGLAAGAPMRSIGDGAKTARSAQFCPLAGNRKPSHVPGFLFLFVAEQRSALTSNAAVQLLDFETPAERFSQCVASIG